MFTGIVEEIGLVSQMVRTEGGATLQVKGPLAKEGSQLGDSIAVNGVCLTVTALAGDEITFGLAPETLERTNLGQLKVGEAVNLERAMAVGGRYGGHVVQGHIDGTGVLLEKTEEGDSLKVKIGATPELLKYIVPKGFIAVDGTSLTVIDVADDYFTLMLVAYTQGHIIFPSKFPGDQVNLEVDVMAKYVEKILASR